MADETAAYRWHNLLPQAIFNTKCIKGLDINAKEFGWVFKLEDHCGYPTIHRNWDAHWANWLAQNPKATKDMVIAELRWMMTNKKSPFLDWIKKGTGPKSCYDAWDNLTTACKNAEGDAIFKALDKIRSSVAARLAKRLGRGAKSIARSSIILIPVVIVVENSQGKEMAACIVDNTAMPPFVEIEDLKGLQKEIEGVRDDCECILEGNSSARRYRQSYGDPRAVVPADTRPLPGER